MVKYKYNGAPGTGKPPKEIVAIIDPETGEVQMEAVGYEGHGCQRDLDETVRILDGVEIDRTMKSCAWAHDNATNANHIHRKGS